MDIIEYLHWFSKELAGLSAYSEARPYVLRYVAERLEEVLQKVKGELQNGDDDASSDSRA